MNIVKLQSQLQKVPDQALIGYVQNPDGQVPSYLALAELTRRKEMRNSAAPQQPAPTQTVADQTIAETQPMQGVAALPVPEQMFNPESYASGGIVAFDEGGDVSTNEVLRASLGSPIELLGGRSIGEVLSLAHPNLSGLAEYSSRGGYSSPALQGGGRGAMQGGNLNLNTASGLGYAEGGEVKRFAEGAYIKNPVGKYYNPADLATYDDTLVQEQLILNPYKSMDQLREEQSKLRGEYGIKNIYDEQRKALEADKAENEKFKSANETDALLAAASGLLGNTSQFFGPGAEAGIKNYLATKQAGQKEYRANARDIRNLGFEIGRADQTMRQAEMTGDQSMFNAERARRDGLLKQAQDVKFKNIDSKNALLSDGAKAAANYDTNIDVAKIKESGDLARAQAQRKTDVYNKAVDNAITQMKNLYPNGAEDIKFKQIAKTGGYASATDAYNAELAQYKAQNIIGMALEAGYDPADMLSLDKPKKDEDNPKKDEVKPEKNTDKKPSTKPLSAKVPQISTDEEFLALPDNAEYIGPDGIRRKKPKTNKKV